MASSSKDFSKQEVSTESGSEPRVLLEFIDEGSIAVITLNDPKFGNPMSPEMGDAFREIVDRLKEIKELRAAIVRGAGKNFSVGGHRNMLTRLADMLGFYDRWLALLDIPVPVIAAIEGDCIGVAPIFACASDISLADESANFQITFAGLGLYPGMAMSYVVPKIVGAQRAALLMVAGASFSGSDAAAYGLVAKSVPKDLVHEEALKIARQIAANAAEVVRPLTRVLRIKRSELQPVLESDATRQAESYATEEFRMRVAKYLPSWYDK